MVKRRREEQVKEANEKKHRLDRLVIVTLSAFC